MQNPTKHQHTIPKCYLKAFANGQKELFKKQKLTNESPEDIIEDLNDPHSLKWATVVDDFYTVSSGNDPMLIETRIYANQIENRYVSIYNILTDPIRETFNMEERTWILTCLLSMHCRTPKQFRLFESTIPESYQHEIHKIREDYKGAHLKDILPNLIKAHEFKRVLIYKVSDGSEFITSDNPVLIIGEGTKLMNNTFKEQFNCDNIVMIPLDPKHCCVLFHAKDKNGIRADGKVFYNKIQREEIDCAMVQNINWLMLESADKTYYGTEQYMKAFFNFYKLVD